MGSARREAEEVWETFGPEVIEEVQQAIDASLARHPARRTCECPAIEALKVVVLRDKNRDG